MTSPLPHQPPTPQVVNVNVKQSVRVGRQSGGCAGVLGVTFLIFLVTKYWWVIAAVVVVALVVWMLRRAIA